MKYGFLLIAFIAISSTLRSQRFTPEIDRYAFANLRYPRAIAADINGDGDADVMLSGESATGDRVLLGYPNNGRGEFPTEVEILASGAMSFDTLDLERDGDPDLVVVRKEGQDPARLELYRNDGSGGFDRVPDDFFPNSAVASYWGSADFDLDGDTDLLVMGTNEEREKYYTLYTNRGDGKFDESIVQDIVPKNHTKIVIGDLNADGYPDLVVSDRDYLLTFYRSEVYLNQGNHTFRKQEQGYIAGTIIGKMALGDVDGDGDLDLVVMGTDYAGPSAAVYRNDGQGYFTDHGPSGLQELRSAYVRLLDLDQDGDLDLIAAGDGDRLPSFAEFYENDGEGFFTESPKLNLLHLGDVSTAVADFDRNGQQDVLYTGGNVYGFRLTRMHLNEGEELRWAYHGSLPALKYPRVDMADINGDGRIDLATKGGGIGFDSYFDLHLNQGDGRFERIAWPHSPSSLVQAPQFVDIDGDGDADLFTRQDYCGPDERSSCFYRNDGNGQFTPARLMPEVGFKIFNVVFGDLTGNGLPDMVVTGGSYSWRTFATRVFYNTGDGTLQAGENEPFANVGGGALALGDLNGDAALDLVIGSHDRAEDPATTVYFNDGEGRFGLESRVLQPHASYHISIADVTGDQNEDIVIIIDTGIVVGTTVLYVSDGRGELNLDTTRQLPLLRSGSLSFGDSDQDGDLDMLMTGTLDTAASGVHNVSRHYLNDGNGNFTLNSLLDLPPVWVGSINFVDIDGDTDLDIYHVGDSFSHSRDDVGTLYYNQLNPVLSRVTGRRSKTDNSLELYPNPNAADRLTIRLPAGIQGEQTLSLYSPDGKLVRRRSIVFAGSEATIDLGLTDLPPAVYSVQLRHRKQSWTGRLVVK